MTKDLPHRIEELATVWDRNLRFQVDRAELKERERESMSALCSECVGDNLTDMEREWRLMRKMQMGCQPT